MSEPPSQPATARCAQCGALLARGAQRCPLCGATRLDDIPDEIPAYSSPYEGASQTQTQHATRYFPRWLYRVGVGALIVAVVSLLMGIFSPVAASMAGGALALAGILLGLSAVCAISGSFLIFLAHFGPWPLERL